MERRVIEAQIDVRQAEGEGAELTQIVGYAAVFNSLSQVLWGFREQIEPGAFSGSLGSDVRALWNHDSAYVLGRTTAGTLRLAEDATGLRVEIDPPDTALARSFVESIRRGDVNQMSFGFSVLEDEWDKDDDGQLIRTLRKVKLYEVSPVAFPAYPDTEVGLRSLLGDEVTPPTAHGAPPNARARGGQGREEQLTQETTADKEAAPAAGEPTVDEHDRQAPVDEVQSMPETTDQRALAAVRVRRLRLAEAF